VFLREIASRLTEGLADEIPSLEERVDHILTKQVFDIGITYLTSLLARRSVYCSKHATGERSIAKGFASDAGNIWFERMRHQWAAGKCAHCGASRKALDRGEGLETHAYAFIHTDDIKARVAELFGGDTQFNVIIGNPPYQLDDGGYGTSAVTWKVELQALRTLFGYFVSRKWIAMNPAKELKAPRNIKPNDVEPYTLREQSDILAACDRIGGAMDQRIGSAYERLRA
jgi:hypothetical protein